MERPKRKSVASRQSSSAAMGTGGIRVSEFKQNIRDGKEELVRKTLGNSTFLRFFQENKEFREDCWDLALGQDHEGTIKVLEPHVINDLRERAGFAPLLRDDGPSESDPPESSSSEEDDEDKDETYGKSSSSRQPVRAKVRPKRAGQSSSSSVKTRAKPPQSASADVIDLITSDEGEDTPKRNRTSKKRKTAAAATSSSSSAALIRQPARNSTSGYFWTTSESSEWGSSSSSEDDGGDDKNEKVTVERYTVDMIETRGHVEEARQLLGTISKFRWYVIHNDHKRALAEYRKNELFRRYLTGVETYLLSCKHVASKYKAGPEIRNLLDNLNPTKDEEINVLESFLKGRAETLIQESNARLLHEMLTLPLVHNYFMSTRKLRLRYWLIAINTANKKIVDYLRPYVPEVIDQEMHPYLKMSDRRTQSERDLDQLHAVIRLFPRHVATNNLEGVRNSLKNQFFLRYLASNPKYREPLIGEIRAQAAFGHAGSFWTYAKFVDDLTDSRDEKYVRAVKAGTNTVKFHLDIDARNPYGKLWLSW